MEFLRSLYFVFDEEVQVEIFKGLIFYLIVILIFCILVYVGGKILLFFLEIKGKVFVFVFGIVVVNVIVVVYILYMLREIGII